MPLRQTYGVLLGRVRDVQRADPAHYGRWYHGYVRVTTPRGEFLCAVDVGTPTGPKVHYRVVTDLRPNAALRTLLNRADGFYPLAPSATSGALDFVRSPLLTPELAGLSGASWRWELRSGDTNADGDEDQEWAVWLGDHSIAAQVWKLASGNEALDALERVVTSGQRVLVFGAFWQDGAAPTPPSLRPEYLLAAWNPATAGGPPDRPTQGMHDIHMNQGDPASTDDGYDHQADDGIWQDGGTLVQGEEGRIVAVLTKFRAQTFATGDDGKPALARGRGREEERRG